MSGSGGGGATTQTAFQDTTGTTNQNSNSITNFSSAQIQQQQSAGNQKTQQQSVSQNIDPALQALANQAAGTLASNISGASIDALKSEAVRQFNLNTQQQIDTLAQKYGSQDNSFVQLLQEQGNQDLATQIASLKANYGVTSANSLAGLISATKFGTSTNTASSNTDTLQNLLNQLTSHGTTATSTTSTTNSNSSSFGFGLGTS